ncbi:MAG: phospholipase D family protein [Acidimicrobiaceae bacterium]|nr:phospholipase D family protein [Acidimicrobiaceae bacterium]
MLQPTNRLTLIDAMRPPVGFQIESAMAVTFTLDLRALLAAPAAFALTGTVGIDTDSDQLEPVERWHARGSESADPGADRSGDQLEPVERSPARGSELTDSGGDRNGDQLEPVERSPARGSESADSGAARSGDRLEPVELLHALRSHADKITVFSQVGRIALPASRRIFAFLEGTVVPVDAPGGGIVHPKVWVLRYESCDAPSDSQTRRQRLRVLVASRNLTFDNSWDTVLRFNETSDRRGVGLGPVGELFEGLLDAAVSPVDPVHRQRVDSLAAALRSARFALPDGVEDLRVHVLGLDRPASLPAGSPSAGSSPVGSLPVGSPSAGSSSAASLPAGSQPAGSPLPHDAERSLVISPFVSDGFFETVHPHRIDELVGREESFDALKPAAVANVGAMHVFDDGSATDLDSPEDRLSPHDPGRPLVGLHAKVFAFENAGRARLFVGSANATWASFRTNVEILVELCGSVAELGIDRLCGGNADERGLRDWFISYQPPDEPVPPDETSALDAARRSIASLAVEGTVEPSGTEWAVTYKTHEPLPPLDIVTIHVWPLASPGNRRSVAAGSPFEERFETSLETLSGFLAFELAHRDGTRTEFVMPVTLTGVPEERDRLLLRTLVGSAERFLRYLLAFLHEDSDQLELLDTIERASANTLGDGHGKPSLPVLEGLLRTMRRDPATLERLHPLVSDLATDDALPPGFAELWQAIFKVTKAGASEGASVR